jgi:hypothetical protein
MKWLVGLVWAVVFYFCTCMVAGGVVGGMAGAKEPQNAAAAGARASAEFVGENRPYFFIGAVTAALIGTALGLLPGTTTKAAKSSASTDDWLSQSEDEFATPAGVRRAEPPHLSPAVPYATLEPPATNVPGTVAARGARPAARCARCRGSSGGHATTLRVESGPMRGQNLTLCANCGVALFAWLVGTQAAGTQAAPTEATTPGVWEADD